MHKFIIVFVGLITHVGLNTDTNQRAALIKVTSPKHRAILEVIDTDIDSNSPKAGSKQAFATIAGHPAGKTWFSIEDENIRVVGIPLGKTKNDFTDAVTHLQTITTNAPGKTRQLDSKILNGDLSHGSATSFVKYDGGSVDVVSSFKYEAVFNPPVVPQRCVACEARWTSDAISSNSVDIVSLSGKWVRLHSDATVTIMNLPPKAGDSKHFHMFKSILSGVGGMSTIKDTATPCTGAICPNPKGVTVECTNTQWP
jgi:hypothetical protein